VKFFLLIGQSNASKAFVASSGLPQIAKRYFSKIAQIWLLILATCHRFVFNDFEYTDIVATCRQQCVYVYCQQFSRKIAASMLSCVGNMIALYDAAYYYGNMMAIIRILTILKLLYQIASKLLLNVIILWRRIKLPTNKWNKDSVAAILVVTHT